MTIATHGRSLSEILADMQRHIESMPPEERERREREAREQAEREEERQRVQRHNGRIAALCAAAPIHADVAERIVDGKLSDTKALLAVREWYAARSKPVLLLLGGVGTGKTVAAMWAFEETARSRYARPEYVKMRDLANLYRAGFGEDAERFSALLKAPLLVIDELTTERDVDLGRAALHDVVDERSTRMRPTILLGNASPEQIKARYDARTIDRLRECAARVSVKATSMRKGEPW